MRPEDWLPIAASVPRGPVGALVLFFVLTAVVIVVLQFVLP
jgi:hypothetical protein